MRSKKPIVCLNLLAHEYVLCGSLKFVPCINSFTWISGKKYSTKQKIIPKFQLIFRCWIEESELESDTVKKDCLRIEQNKWFDYRR